MAEGVTWGSPVLGQVKKKAEKLGVVMNFLGRIDHLDPVIQEYQVPFMSPLICIWSLTCHLTSKKHTNSAKSPANRAECKCKACAAKKWVVFCSIT